MNAQIFIDAENIKPEIGFKAIEKFSGKYSVEQVDIFGNESVVSSKYLEAGYNVKNCFFGKNSADTWLCTEIAKTIFEKPKVDTIIIISSDRDFLAAIKLATDQKRKVIFVSDGNGHKNLKAMFYDLRINPDFIELVDFKTDLNAAEKVKIATKPVKTVSQKSTAEKIREICQKKIQPQMKTFFTKNESKFRFIQINYAGNSVEVPFFDGINISTFTNILIMLNVIQNAKPVKNIIADSSLKLENNKIYLIEEKISKFVKVPEKIPTPAPETEKIKTAEPEKNPFNDVVKYFSAHAADAKNIFIKNDGQICEVPFVSGMSLPMFSRLLKGYNIADDAEKIVAESFLDLRGNKIYFRSEEKFFSDLKIDFNKLSAQSLEFIKSNENRIQFFSVAHGNAVHKVPFVEGMELHIFARMLHELKVCGKNASTQQVLKNNGFTVKNNLVYKNQ